MSDNQTKDSLKQSESRIGLGCMNVSHAYGPALAEAEGVELLQSAFELGYRAFDTATLYGFGRNEALVAKALGSVRDQIHLSSKCGMAGVDGKRVIDGRPETIARQIDESLERLCTDHIDLYYLHRVDRQVPVEDSLAPLVKAMGEGKIGAIGLSEVPAVTLERALKVAPIAAVQNEYSLWSRNCEIALSERCRDNGVTLVAFSPVCRGFLGIDWASFNGFVDGDIRKNMPRFQAEAIDKNSQLQREASALACELGLSTSQLALAWLLHKGDHVFPIPGTRSLAHLRENFAAQQVRLGESVVAQLDTMFAPARVVGNRYPAVTQSEIDTERFEFERD